MCMGGGKSTSAGTLSWKITLGLMILTLLGRTAQLITSKGATSHLAQLSSNSLMNQPTGTQTRCRSTTCPREVNMAPLSTKSWRSQCLVPSTNWWSAGRVPHKTWWRTAIANKAGGSCWKSSSTICRILLGLSWWSVRHLDILVHSILLRSQNGWPTCVDFGW